MKVSVIGGAGYVGLITALGSSSMGHDVIATDIDEEKVKSLNNNISPIYEESLDSLLKHCNSRNKISFTTDLGMQLKILNLLLYLLELQQNQMVKLTYLKLKMLLLIYYLILMDTN